MIHCGAAMKGGWPEHKGGTVVGTQNVIDACKKHSVKQLVHISSMSVIDWAGSAGNGPVSEAANLEPRARRARRLHPRQARGRAARRRRGGAGPAGVILRPGQIFGGGIPLINGAVARNAGGRWLVLGDGKLELPLVYIDDVVDAIMAAIDKQLVHGEVIQIIDPEHLTQEDVLGLAGGAKPIIRVPRAARVRARQAQRVPARRARPAEPGRASTACKSALARLHYESDRARPAARLAPARRRPRGHQARPAPRLSVGSRLLAPTS